MPNQKRRGGINSVKAALKVDGSPFQQPIKTLLLRVKDCTVFQVIRKRGNEYSERKKLFF